MYGLKKTFIKKTIGQFGLAPGQIKKTISKSLIMCNNLRCWRKNPASERKNEEMPRTGLRRGLQSWLLFQNSQRREPDLSRQVTAQFENPENPENPRQTQKIPHILEIYFE